MPVAKTIGAAFLIIGLCVGAGMIAIPMVTYEYGVWLSGVIIVAVWAVMLCAAMLLIEMNYLFRPGTNMQRMANAALGKFGWVLVWLSYVALMYAGMSAYVSGGSSVLNSLLIQKLWHGAPLWLSLLIFVALFSPFVYKGTHSVDWLNRLFLGTKLLFFVLAIVSVMHLVRIPDITPKSNWISILPLFVLSFIYHQILPTLRVYLKCTKRQLQKLTFWASLVPLVLYLFWLFVILGTFPLTGKDSFAALNHSQSTVGDFLLMYTHVMQNTFFRICIDVFYSVAVVTSFLGVSLSLFHFNGDTYRMNNLKPLNYLITFGVPTVVMLFDPNIFVSALNYAGMFGAVLFLIAPSMMFLVFQNKGQLPQSRWLTVLASGLFLFGLFVVCVQLFQ